MKILDSLRRVGVLVRSVVADAGAWRRGERRIAPRGARGRIYEKKPGAAAPGAANSMKGGSAAVPGGGTTQKARVVKSTTLRPSRVYRAATGAWEEIQPKEK